MSESAPHALQDRLLRLLGNDATGRSPLVAAMLRRDANETTSYWLQLLVAIGIATLGLVLGSTAVIIGAMLVAPLMGPIVGLAMGLASGSPFLVLRSAGRIALSIVFAIAGAALITQTVPFHELNAEISARTSPTVLDLATASFCALAGVYATLRPGSDTAATAAGTSIGISLVPPLCASGFGFGIRAWQVASGAALLFLTNLVAIVVVGTVAFVAAGFNRVEVISLEREELAKGGKQAPLSRALATRLARLFESRWGPFFRFLMPFLLLAAVYVPLRRALDEVAWEVRVRSAVSEALAQEPSRIVESRVRIENQKVDVVVVILGNTVDANAARTRIEDRVHASAQISPHIEVFGIPDATEFAGLESTLMAPRPTVSQPTPTQALADARTDARAAVEAVWPATAAGDPIAIETGDAGDAGLLRVRVVHLGPRLGNDAAEAVRRGLEPTLGAGVDLVDVAVPSSPITREQGDAPFVAAVADGVRATSGVDGVSICVRRPAPTKDPTPEVDLARAIDGVLAGSTHVVDAGVGAWNVQFVPGDCPPLADGGIPAEVPGDGDGGPTPGDAGPASP